MQAVGEGDMHAFEQIVLRHQSAAWRVAWRYIGDADEAEDMVQEAFLRVLDAAERYRPTAAFRTYFYRILTRLCMDHARKKRPILTDSLPETLAPGPTQAEQVERQERELAVRQGLEALPPRYRLAIVMRYFEGLSGAEIAGALQTTPKAVERMLARARKKLARRLGKLLEE
jgi:RNA polymerase sigma-70 factor (ECF subfamily)